MEWVVVGGHSLTSYSFVHCESDGILKIGFIITHYLSMYSGTSSVAFTFKMILLHYVGKLLPVSYPPSRYFTKENGPLVSEPASSGFCYLASIPGSTCRVAAEDTRLNCFYLLLLVYQVCRFGIVKGRLTTCSLGRG